MQYYYEAKPDVQNYHYINHKKDPFVAPHFHSAIELVVVRHGCMAAVINGEALTIEEGYGCFVNSFCLHSYSAAAEDTEVYAFVGSTAVFDPVFSDIGGIPPVIFKFDDFSLLDNIVTHYNDSTDDGIRRSIFRGAASLIPAIIAENNTPLQGVSANSTAEICSVLRYISDHFTEELTLSSLSARFGYSPQYFSKLFHRYMKINLTEYISVARVNHAKKLLDTNRAKSVAEIAFESGFSSLPTFYRTYKKVFGTLPRD